MNTLQQIIAPLTMLLGLTTACGVLMHDTNLDKAFVSAFQKIDTYVASADETGKTKPSSSPHTHAEGPSLSKVLKDGHSHPRNTPRHTDRKHLYQKRMSRDGQDFDGHRLMLGSAQA